jgi:NAD(P)-dependent dehydrogenase (short-subunit alcohol dehydrogenase family)
MGHFTGKFAVVTGAASGIGRGICEALCEQGAIVYAADIQEEALDALVQTATGAGEIRAVVLDVTSPNDFARVIGEVTGRHGRLDLMVNNAGIGVVGDFRQIELDDIRSAVDVNLWGVVYGTKSTSPRPRVSCPCPCRPPTR